MNASNVLNRLIKPVLIITGIIVVYGLIGFFLLPRLISAKIPEVIESATGRKASIQEAGFDPFLLRLSLKGFSMLEKNGKDTFVAFDQFYIDLNAFRSIGNAALVIDKIILSKPYVKIARYQDGQYNFSSLAQKQEEPPAEENSDGLFPVIIDKFSLREGRAIWQDRLNNADRKEELNPISFEIDNLTTKSSETFPMHLVFSLGSGGQLDWQGTAGIQPISSTGKIKLEKVDLQRIQHLAMADADFSLKGNEEIELDYSVSSTDKGHGISIQNSRIKLNDVGFSQHSSGLALELKDLVLESNYNATLDGEKWQFNADKTKLAINALQILGIKTSKAVISIPEAKLDASLEASNVEKALNLKFNGNSFTVRNYSLFEQGNAEPYNAIPEVIVRGIKLDLAKQEVIIDSASAKDGDFKAWLDQNGKLNYIALFAESYVEATEGQSLTEKVDDSKKTAKAPVNPWHIAIKDVDINRFAMTFEDRSLKKKMVLKADPINLKVNGFNNDKGTKVPFRFNSGINKNGSINIEGDAIIEPFSLKVTMAANDIGLEPFQPYVEPNARLDIIDGKFAMKGDLAFATDDKTGLDLKFKGDTSIADLVTRDQILHRDFVKWKKLSLQGIDADLQANRYSAKQLVMNKPYARVTIKKDKSVNINDIFDSKEAKSRKTAPKKVEPKATAAKQKPLYYKLDKIQIVDGASDFADLSLILPFAAPIKNLNGGATGISSDKRSQIKASLKGYAFEMSPVDIEGQISPNQGDFNVELNFIGMPMPLVSPYMVQFAGYKVEKGKLTLGLKYQVEKGQLNASNNILIDQFELGEEVDNPEAVSVPLELAVALLKDSNGKIKLDVPITGSLEDPEFSVGGVIADALLNTITKIVTSPFTAIASLIGSEENLDLVKFAPGSAELDSEQSKKLDGLATALYDRPVLNLEIKGTAYQDQDWPALREAALVDQLKKVRADEITEETGKKTLPEYVDLSEKDYKRLLADKFIAQFPQLADKSLLGTPRLIDPSAGEFYAVAKQKLSEAIKPEPNRLKELASERAQAIAKFIVQQRGIPDARVFILDPAIDPEREDATQIVSFLSLKTN